MRWQPTVPQDTEHLRWGRDAVAPDEPSPGRGIDQDTPVIMQGSPSVAPRARPDGASLLSARRVVPKIGPVKIDGSIVAHIPQGVTYRLSKGALILTVAPSIETTPPPTNRRWGDSGTNSTGPRARSSSVTAHRHSRCLRRAGRCEPTPSVPQVGDQGCVPGHAERDDTLDLARDLHSQNLG